MQQSGNPTGWPYKLVVLVWMLISSFAASAEEPAMLRLREAALTRQYVIEAVSIINKDAGITLSGELTHPHGSGPFPGVVLLSGSGPQDRDEAIAGHRPFLILSDFLTRQGVAVLRFDDRGVGGSSGDFQSATLDDFASDAAAALAWLKRHESVDAQRVGFAGHSEGGLIAPMAAQREAAAFMMLMAAPTQPFIQVLSEQLAMRLAPDHEVVLMTGLIKRISATQEADQARAKVQEDALAWLDTNDVAPQQAESMVAFFTSPPMLRVITHDPEAALARFSGPILGLYGADDRRIHPINNSAIIEKAARSPLTKVVIVEGLNHLFQPVLLHTGVRAAPMPYEENEVSFDDRALKQIGAWLKSGVLQ